MSEPKQDVIVIGAGLAGLTAALHLSERGVKVTVLEADPQFPGGRVSSKPAVEFDGWSFPGEHGVHGIWSPYVNLQAMLARNRIRPVFVPAQEEDWIYRRGNRLRKAKVGSAMRQSWLPAPFHYLNLFLRPSFLATIELRDFVSLISVWYLLIFAVGADPLKEGQSFGRLKLQDMIYYWSPALRAFMIGLTRSGLSAQPEEIPLSGYLAFLRFYSVMRRDAWVFSYLPQGGGISLIDPIVQRLHELGGTLHLGRSVTRIEKQGDDWRVTWQSTENEQQSGALTAPQIILATDAPNTAKILQNSPSTAQKAADLEFPRGMETAIVRFWFDVKPRTTSEAGIFTGDFMLDNFFWLDQIMEPYLSWGRQSGGCALEAHIYGPPELLAEPDALILAKAQNGILAAFPELRGHKITQILQRNQPTHTLFGIGEADVHLGIHTPWPNLYCCGDWVRDPNPALFLERAVTTAILAANAALEQQNLPQWPLIPHPAPEPFVAWIEKLMQRGRKKRKAKRRIPPPPRAGEAGWRQRIENLMQHGRKKRKAKRS